MDGAAAHGNDRSDLVSPQGDGASAQEPTGDGANGLSRRDLDILAFERQWWKYAGAKEDAIKELFGLSATRYYQVLNALVDRPEALAAEPSEGPRGPPARFRHPLDGRPSGRIMRYRHARPVGSAACARATMVEVVSRTPEIPSRAPAPSGPPLRAFAMVLISLGILFAGLGFASLGDSDDEPAPAAAPTTTTAAAPAAPSTRSAAVPTAPAPAAANGGTSAAGDGATTTTAVSSAPSMPVGSGTAFASDTSASATAPVRVFNNSEVAGLAAQTAAYLEDEGYTISETGNYSEGLLPQTSVFYGSSPGEQQTATAVAESLGVTAQPRFEGIRDAAPGVIVIVTSR
ncbi:LytR cell envelope-related transcriptional attenuator [Rhodococcus rhodochrous J38]|nr:LytR cell envelope-related transcriptional attenuator [Rhodococcus rhodochrous J38]